MKPLTILCIASYKKGDDFMRECKRQGCRTILLTSESIKDEDWPRESLDEIYAVPDVQKIWNMDDAIKGVSYLARTEQIDSIVALDDFDLEKAAALREHLRIAGMGDTTTRYFRDKLAMRLQAREAGIPIPDFVHALNHERMKEYMERVPSPWLLKPRSEASATGIKFVHKPDDLWGALEELGDKQSFYVMERYVAGDIYHVDSIVSENKIIFAIASRYGKPPLDVAHGGGVFTTMTVPYNSIEEQTLLALNREVLHALGLKRGVSHTEFIHSDEDGKFYFLETSARVGGAHIAELNEAASGINLWAEWAKIEVHSKAGNYVLPPVRKDYAGLLVSLSKQEYPDTSAYNDDEIVWRLKKRHHAGLIVMSSGYERVEELLNQYTERFAKDFMAIEPPRDKPID